MPDRDQSSSIISVFSSFLFNISIVHQYDQQLGYGGDRTVLFSATPALLQYTIHICYDSFTIQQPLPHCSEAITSLPSLGTSVGDASIQVDWVRHSKALVHSVNSSIGTLRVSEMNLFMLA